MDFENIRFETDNGIARLTLHRPDKLNNFKGAMRGESKTFILNVRTKVKKLATAPG
jgi:enoyl-CoA hydratase/carnithine racemase